MRKFFMVLVIVVVDLIVLRMVSTRWVIVKTSEINALQSRIIALKQQQLAIKKAPAPSPSEEMRVRSDHTSL